MEHEYELVETGSDTYIRRQQYSIRVHIQTHFSYLADKE